MHSIVDFDFDFKSTHLLEYDKKDAVLRRGQQNLIWSIIE